MALLIDSTVFIEMERRNLGLDVIDDLAPNQPTALASITASELLYGVHRADSESRRIRRSAFMEEILSTIAVVAFDLSIARVHARLLASLAAIGRPVGNHDVIIAATALSLGYAVLTDNSRDFDRVPGLTVLTPTW